MSRIVEQWTFPIGSHVAELTIESQGGQELEPDDMDALFEAGMIFKRQVIRRHQQRLSRIAQPDFEI